MRKRDLTIGAIIGALVAVLWASTDWAGDGAWVIVIAMVAGAGALIGGLAGPIVALIREVQELAELPEKSKANDEAEGDQLP